MMSPQEDITRGDVAWLRSGGPAMTVLNDPDDNGIITVAWFHHGQIQKATIAVAAVTKSDPTARGATRGPAWLTNLRDTATTWGRPVVIVDNDSVYAYDADEDEDEDGDIVDLPGPYQALIDLLEHLGFTATQP